MKQLDNHKNQHKNHKNQHKIKTSSTKIFERNSKSFVFCVWGERAVWRELVLFPQAQERFL